jgi:hypothetical protein
MCSNENIPNPITLAFSLAEGLQELLKQTLAESGLEEEEIQHIIAHLGDVGVDNKLLFSLNRKYKSHAQLFDEFATQKFSTAFLKAYYSCTPTHKRIQHLYVHQGVGINSILSETNTVIATGTGSGKTETFLWPIVDYCMRNQDSGVKAIIVYPMNALANDQLRRIGDLVQAGNQIGENVTFGAFTGLTKNVKSAGSSDEKKEHRMVGQHIYREEFRSTPPDILLTNYVMLDRLLTSVKDRSILLNSSASIKYLVFDEIHTYRGNKATHLRGLILRVQGTIQNRPIMIGTSATLVGGEESRSKETESYQGYLGKISSVETDEFILPLFGSEPYNLVLPEYEDDEVIESASSPPLSVSTKELGWKLSFDNKEGLENLSFLLAKSFKIDDLYSKGDTPSLANATLRQDPFIQTLREKLRLGPMSFIEIVQLLQPMISNAQINTVELAKSYLSAIAFSNQFADGEPILDFRIHLFLQNIGGSLQLCVNCGKYHSGLSSTCDDCAWPLFKTYRGNIHQAIGKISGNELRRELRKQSDDHETTFLVKLSRNAESVHGSCNALKNDSMDSLNFSLGSDLRETGVPLIFNPEGGINLSLLGETGHGNPSDIIIPLISLKNDQQYLQKLLISLLDSQMSESKKILGFIDNREKASRHIAILKERFAINYLYETLKFFAYEISRNSIEEAVAFLIENVLAENICKDEKQLFEKDFPMWIARELSLPQRFGRSSNLFKCIAPPPSDDLNQVMMSPLELEIIEIFFQERAIDKRFLIDALPPLLDDAQLDRKDYKYIKYRLSTACQYRGICFSGQTSPTRKYSATVLSDQAQIYKTFIQIHGIETIEETVLRLTDDGNHPELPFVALNVSSDDELEILHYYLKAEWVKFIIEPSREQNFQQLRKKFYLEVDLHNSDIHGDKREVIEKKFQDGETNFLLATSTLEMGIDIGALSTVLLIGAPPLPSSYAQRAGRAGRGSVNKYALIVNFFSEAENHDNYYYDRPKELVSGYISPPAYNPNNIDVLSQHVNALLLKDYIQGEYSLHELHEKIYDSLPEFKSVAKQVFPNLQWLEYYLETKFVKLIAELREKSNKYGVSLNTLYNSGIFPDYGFRHDEVSVLDKQSLDSSGKDIDQVIGTRDHETISKHKITYRDPENAYYKLIPGTSVYMAGDEFTISSSDKYFEKLEDEDGSEAISHHYLWGYRSKDPKRESELKRYDRTIKLVPISPPEEKLISGLLRITHYPECKLSFRNNGIVRSEGEVENLETRVGCDLKREGIVLSMPSEIAKSASTFISLLSALDRAIKDRYGLDENDLKFMLDAQIPPFEEGVSKALIYDASGNGAIPFKKIAHEFEAEMGTLQRAYDRLNHCPNAKCEHGCYLCLRSYGTQYFASDLSKSQARMTVGYLLGKNPFVPDLPDLKKSSKRGLYLNLFLEKQKGSDGITLHAGEKSYSRKLTSQQNNDFFSIFTEAIAKSGQTEQRDLRVIIPHEWSYLYDFISKKKLSKKARMDEKVKFEELLFQLLRFKNLEVLHYEHLFKEQD